MTLLELLRLSSRTFALGIEQLPSALRGPVMVAYLLLRVSDYLEDNEEMPPEQKVPLLRLWDEVLAGRAGAPELVARLPGTTQGSDNPDARVMMHTVQVFEALQALPAPAREAVTRHVRDSTQGMARWVERGPRVSEETDLDDYMHEVAGRVGYLLTDLFAWHSGTIRRRRDYLMPLAREFGLALQTVNIIRGMREDRLRGWIFIPETFCQQVGVTREQVFQPEYRAQALQVLDMLAEKAQRHLEAAKRYISALPAWQHRVRLFCLFPLMFAERTLALSRRNHQVFEDEAKISRDEVRRIIRDTTLWGWRNGWIQRYAQQLARS
ncbi:MAG: phytoene/squalene synthase family protein [Hyalangium sp.]|uniref:phytoene/squalene synthase family protein n=1 Tax=Hyalangium sp. TaxID=2028555 RepID=UPI00389A2FA4